MNDINNISSTWRCFTRTSLTSPSVPNLELWPTSSLSSVIVRYWQPNESLFWFVCFDVDHWVYFKATHDASHYYASYDLLKVPIKYSFWIILLFRPPILVSNDVKPKVNNAVNTTVLIDKVLEDMGKGPMDKIEEEEFRAIVCEIWKRISLLGRWTGSGAWGSEYAEDEELMRRLGEIFG